ncbi:hypothetical protein vseg_016222 [Gypsophila vaccaria]
MMREYESTTTLISYAKLAFLFLSSLGVGILFFSSRFVDYSSSSPLQVQTPYVSHSHDNVSKTETSTEFDSLEQDIDLRQFVQGSSSSSTPNEVATDEPKPKCDLLKGDWIPYPKGPAYNNNTCRFIEPHQNCMRNGRPDTGYLFWRWKPRDCELPKFNPKRFLNLMRNKEFAFIGDSISRNQAQSLLCILSQVELPEENIDYGKRQATFVFPSYNFTLVVIWSPYFIKANTTSSVDLKIYLDELDENWTAQYNVFDYVVIVGGPWFMRTITLYENNTVQGCHNCPGKTNLTDFGLDYSYRKALNRVFNFIAGSSHKPQVLFMTITPSHYEHGNWDDGGYCNRKVPVKEGREVNLSEGDGIMYEVGIQEFDKAINGTSDNVKLFDTTYLSLLRPDGHPGLYRIDYSMVKDKNANATASNDCLHWCLPGPIDTWNELMFEMLMR